MSQFFVGIGKRIIVSIDVTNMNIFLYTIVGEDWAKSFYR